MRVRLTPETIHRIVDLIPDVWLTGEPQFPGYAEHRAAYTAYLLSRLEASPVFVEEAQRARALRL